MYYLGQKVLQVGVWDPGFLSFWPQLSHVQNGEGFAGLKGPLGSLWGCNCEQAVEGCPGVPRIPFPSLALAGTCYKSSFDQLQHVNAWIEPVVSPGPHEGSPMGSRPQQIPPDSRWSLDQASCLPEGDVGKDACGVGLAGTHPPGPGQVPICHRRQNLEPGLTNTAGEQKDEGWWLPQGEACCLHPSQGGT